jgi:hypothetical protein
MLLRGIIANICLNMGILQEKRKIIFKYSLFTGLFYTNMTNNPRRENILHISKIWKAA